MIKYEARTSNTARASIEKDREITVASAKTCFFIWHCWSTIFENIRKLLFIAENNIHLMCAPEGNSEFCFPESLNVSRDEVEGNIETRGKTKLTISRGSTH